MNGSSRRVEACKPQRRLPTLVPLLLGVTLAALLQVAHGADAPVAIQVVMMGTPAGDITAFIQLKSAVALGGPLPALYASKRLLDAQPYVTGLKLLPYTGDNPTDALLVLKDSPVETEFVDCVFYQLPDPALAVINSTARLDNVQADQKFSGGRLLVASKGASVAVSNSVFQDANQEGDGGVFYIQSSVLDFKNATFVGNSASGHGGAIYADTDSKLSGSICTFANNTAGDSGGAVYQTGFFPDMPGKTTNATQAGADIVAFSAGTFAFKNISFVRNMAASGGALHQEFVSGNIVDCQFSGNTAKDMGGGIAQVSSHAQLAGSSFFGNSAAQDGGAMHQTNSIGDVAGSNFGGNTAGGNGGALARLRSQGDVNGSRFADNTAAQGGSIHLVGSIVTNVYSSEFSDGKASAEGGAIFANGSTIMLVDSNAFTDMTARSGAGVYAEDTSIGAISNSVMVNGAASADGGALSFKDARIMNILYNTFQNNTAVRGGAISALTSQTSISGSKFINNSASAAGATGAALFSDGGQVTLGVGNIYTPLQAALAISK